jgi:hypothetical protein
MIVEITNRRRLPTSIIAYPFQHGLELITSATSYNGYTYEVIDEHVFMLAVIKYGIEFTEINEDTHN